MITAFLGKGGVGKTSIASACAMKCASVGKTLIVSTDFMPSLRHIFTGEVENLDVLELSEKEVAQRWKKRYGEDVTTVLREFVDVDDWILDHIASSPGVAEEFMIANIMELEALEKYKYLIWDTAASSSTMHLLYLEREFYEHLDRDIRIYLRLKNRFRMSGSYKILDEWKALANSVWHGLTETSMYLVTTDDELSLLQADEIEKELAEMGLALKGRVYNRHRGSEIEYPGYSTSVPELDGSAREIARKIVPFISSVCHPVSLG